ncbi:hypothetical protein AB0N28_29940, partial [Streptomyces sp. NPDC051130]|uniref:hypothetical protein n=1 Tax=Streptomyces sp. NPDC051130 TaxID=3157223 RepID=UPI0034241E4A
MQNWRISTRLVSLLTLPVVAATTLGGFRINDSLNDIAQLEHMQLLTTMTRQAAKTSMNANRMDKNNQFFFMPHPEHAVEPLIGTGRTDGFPFFTSVLK